MKTRIHLAVDLHIDNAHVDDITSKDILNVARWHLDTSDGVAVSLDAIDAIDFRAVNYTNAETHD